MFLSHLQHFASVHYFQTPLLALVLGVIGDKVWYAIVSCKREQSLRALLHLLSLKDLVPIGAALAGLATVGHGWHQELAGAVDTICK